MFDNGLGELLLIAVVALVVLGPERLPKAARFAGLWVRRARAQWYSMKSELEREMAADELKRSLQDAKDVARDIGRRTEEATRALEDEVREADALARREVESMRRQSLDGLTPGDPVTSPPSLPVAAGTDIEAEAEAEAGAAPGSDVDNTEEGSDDSRR